MIIYPTVQTLRAFPFYKADLAICSHFSLLQNDVYKHPEAHVSTHRVNLASRFS
jgi:hypothetical protein